MPPLIPKLAVPLRIIGGGPPRINWTPNPSFETDLSHWDTTGSFWINSGGALTRVTAAGFQSDGEASMRITTPGATVSEGSRSIVNVPITIGEPLTISAWLRGGAGETTGRLCIGDSVIGQGTQTVTLGPQPQRVSATVAPVKSASSTQVAVLTPGAVASTIYVDAVLIEYGLEAGEYFPTAAQLKAGGIILNPDGTYTLPSPSGRFATVEQDSIDEVAASVYALLGTPRGSRLEEPEYGIVDPTFEQLPLDLTEALEQIAAWEPRAQVEFAEEIEALTDRVTVGVDT